MSATTSATTGRRYGLKRVCRTWERSRSALYARRARAQCRKRGAGPARRWPTPALSDAQLLAAIRSDLARSPFQGEGHRKVPARLLILDGIRVSRTRVLRVMRVQKQLAKQDLLIVDELGYVPLSKTGAELLFEVFSRRYEQASTLVTSNLPFNEWTEIFGSERLTGALLDRLTHHVHILELNGESYRLAHSKKARHPAAAPAS